MEQNSIQIGALYYYVNRKYVGDRHPKELILEKIIAAKRYDPLDKESNYGL